MGLYRARKLLETPRVGRARKLLETPRVGRVWNVLEKPGGIYTILHYGGRHERSLGLSSKFQKSLVYTCTQVCT